MKQSTYLIVFMMLLSSAAFAEDPNPAVEGRIVSVDVIKSQIVVSNVLADKSKPHEKRVRVKPGMIGDFKRNDYVRVRLMPDGRRARTIEKIRK